MSGEKRYARLLAALSGVTIGGALLSLVGGYGPFPSVALGNITIGACCLPDNSCTITGNVPCLQANGTYFLNQTCSACATSTATATQTGTATATATATATGTATATATATPTRTPVPQGGSCMSDAQCETNVCADGVCCDQACDAPGQTCNAAGVCVASAEAPAASAPALALAVILLTLVAAVALLRRRRSIPDR